MLIGISGKISSGKDTIGKIIQYLVSNNKHMTFNEYVKQESFRYSDMEIKKFADKLKDIVCLLIGCTREQLEDHEFKNTPLGKEWNKLRYRLHFSGPSNPMRTIDGNYIYKNLSQETFDRMTAEERKFHNAEEVVLTPRLLLQLLGTDCGRNIIHPNIWVNALMSNYKARPLTLPDETTFIENEEKWFEDRISKWIITDMRFPNELKAVKSRGGITIRVDRDINCSLCSGKGCTHCFNGKVQNQGLHESETALDNAEFDYTIENNGTIEELIEKVKKILIKEKIINGNS